MKHGQILKAGTTPYSGRVTEADFYPDIDSSYSVHEYSGSRVSVPPPTHSFGIKAWSNMLNSMQGMAIHGDILVRMYNNSSSTTHYIFRIGETGALTQVATFSASTTAHSNTLQFAPLVESGNDYPYIYVSDLEGSCEVFSITSEFVVTQVQKITVPTGWQVQIGDDGHIWAISGGGTALRFIKYRKVAVSEGANITLTANDIIDDMVVEDKFPSAQYTFQGSKFKFGKAWIPIGTSGADQKRALLVYDLAAKRTVANIDLTFVGTTVEFEDCDFWNDSLIICTYKAASYILRF